MCKTLILLTLAVIAAADSGIQPVARSPIFAGARLARRQGTCAEFGDEHCYHKCMPIGSVCCADGTGTFCLAGQYCTTGDDGVPSCCRNNDICFGPGSISTTTQFKTGTGTATFTDTDPIVPHKTQTTSDTFFVTHSTINDTFFVTNSPITETEVPSQVSSGFGPTRVATFTDKTTEAAATSQPVTFTGGAIWDAVPLRAVAVAAVVGVFGAWLV